MVRRSKNFQKIKQTLSAEKVRMAMEDLIKNLLLNFDFSKNNYVIIGIQTRGFILAKRLAEEIKKRTGVVLPIGALDITLYRDDVRSTGIQPIVGETHLDFDIDDKNIILVDDVLFTGRTIRAAIDELIDYGRPKSIRLVVLIDRGHRELPIQADFSALKVDIAPKESINLRLNEIDQMEDIVITEAAE